MSIPPSIFDNLENIALQALNQNVYSNTNDYLSAINAGRDPISRTSIANLPPQGNIEARGSNAFKGGNIYDDRSPNPLKGIGTFAIDAPRELNSVDVIAITNWVKNVSKELFGGIDFSNVSAGQGVKSVANSKGVQFLANQFLLTSLNPGSIEVGGGLNQIWNPLSLVGSAVPFVRTFPQIVGPTLAAVASDYSTNVDITVAAGTERLKLMQTGLYVPNIGPYDFLRLTIPTPGFFGNLSKRSDTLQSPGIPGLTIEGQVLQEGPGAIIANALPNVHMNPYTPSMTYDQNPVADLASLEKAVRQQENVNALGTPFDIEGAAAVAQAQKLQALFQSPGFPILLNGQMSDQPVYQWYAKGNLTRISSRPEVPTADNVSARMIVDNVNEVNGTFTQPIDDDKIYMPFMFQDLRDTPSQFLYFRAFLKEGLAETFSPEWNMQKYYGRVDPVPLYQGTTRDISLAFDVVAWTPADLPIMWKKLHKLQSMVYPSFDDKGILKSAPVVRMRVGDLFSAYSAPGGNLNNTKLGLPGVITSLDFAYDDGIWNLEDDFRIPRKVSVTISFTVVHDGNPGVYSAGMSNQTTTGNTNASHVNTFGTAVQDQSTGNFLGLTSGIRGLQNAVEQYYTQNRLDE